MTALGRPAARPSASVRRQPRASSARRSRASRRACATDESCCIAAQLERDVAAMAQFSGRSGATVASDLVLRRREVREVGGGRNAVVVNVDADASKNAVKTSSPPRTPRRTRFARRQRAYATTCPASEADLSRHLARCPTGGDARVSRPSTPATTTLRAGRPARRSSPLDPCGPAARRRRGGSAARRVGDDGGGPLLVGRDGRAARRSTTRCGGTGGGRVIGPAEFDDSVAACSSTSTATVDWSCRIDGERRRAARAPQRRGGVPFFNLAEHMAPPCLARARACCAPNGCRLDAGRRRRSPTRTTARLLRRPALPPPLAPGATLILTLRQPRVRRLRRGAPEGRRAAHAGRSRSTPWLQAAFRRRWPAAPPRHRPDRPTRARRSSGRPIAHGHGSALLSSAV